MYDSIKLLSGGAGKLSGGSAALYSGIGTLKDGGRTLADGTKKLEGGAKELNDGMIKFNDEGISVLTGAVDKALPEITDTFRALREASKEYNSYSGISDKMEGSVKFIYLVDGTK